MARELGRHVRHLKRCIALLRYVDHEVYERGRDIFSTDGALALWLCEPARSLRGAAPIIALQTEEGRKAVAKVLTALAHGTVL